MHSFQDVIGNHSTLLPVVVVRIVDMINAKIVEIANADSIE